MIGKRVRMIEARTSLSGNMWIRPSDDVWPFGRQGWLLSGVCAGRVLIGWNDTGSEWSWVPVSSVEVIA